ncbi:MATH and LRR domain-containing protein PFE0570w isoform X6 [Maniola jurtina]|uniref:MATH and LRR domain-containing protein PFE0570w isoform X6 n=1 Tax=Maniola jurtina TaxID=191418 RepID=UPI001E686ED9|nr:MATH and LRR domain-containing protein PFE0570w isoform X6 [Maniola jurtina]
MKKRTISKLISIFGSKKGKRQEQQQSSKSSRSPSPESVGLTSPVSNESFRPILHTPTPSRPGPPPSPPVPTHPIAPTTPEPSGPLPLLPCPVCERTFVPQSLAKHAKICEKMTVKKRKTFDSSRQRREGVATPSDCNFGTDLEQYLPKNFGLPENSPFLEKSPPNTAKTTLKPKAPSVRSAIMKPAADLQKCPHCSRNFGMRAFERHVEWCADKAKILPAAPQQPPPHIADAKQRLNARTQYKAPPVRGRRSSQTRDKSSNSRSASVESSRGVSPPREYGDYRHPRTRASESMSSNDCHEDASPHVPVIRNSRTMQHNSSGDANIKARQARLARDLSSSRNIQGSYPSPVQQTNTDPNINKHNSQRKQRNQLNTKNKQEQLKKLEETVSKFNERINENAKQKATKSTKIHSEMKDSTHKTQIPVLKKLKPEEKKTSEEKCNEDKASDRANSKKIKPTLRSPTKTKIRKETKNNIKDRTMSLDSLDDSSVVTNRIKNCQSIGINTELLCPCVPCVIHDTFEEKIIIKRQNKTNNKQLDQKSQLNPEVELLFKNLNMTSSSDIMFSKNGMQLESIKDVTFINCNQSSTTSDDKKSVAKIDTEIKHLENDHTESGYFIAEATNEFNTNTTDDIANLSIENMEENQELDLSGNNFEDSFEIKKEVNNSNIVCRHGSGDTYTKFTEDPADLEEFFNLTDKMIQSTNENDINATDIEKSLENIHTPQTNSLESMNEQSTEIVKLNFSDALQDLKNDFKDLLQEVKDQKISINVTNNCENMTDDDDSKRKVCDMEHITVYQLKYYERESNIQIENNLLDKNTSELKLPAINETNRFLQREDSDNIKNSKKKKGHKKCRLLGQQKKTDKKYQTFIIKEKQEEKSDEEPPLKLPRIDIKSSNNVVGEKLFPSSVKRSTSLLDSIQKKTATKAENSKGRHQTDQLEEDLMQSLKDFDKLYESERKDNHTSNKDIVSNNNNKKSYSSTTKKDFRRKIDHKRGKPDNTSNGNYTPNGKSSTDSAYSSLNRISPSKLSLCNAKESNGLTSLEQIPAGSDSSGSQKDDIRSISSEEFLAMERSAELDGPIKSSNGIQRSEMSKESESLVVNDKRVSSRASSRHSPTWHARPEALSSSGSESSLHRPRRDSVPAPRLSRFCHECGSRFPVETAKFCIECGVKRLAV